MIIKSIKGDGVEHLAADAHTDLWGWEALSMALAPSGIDEITGDQTYRESDRKVSGKEIEIALHNDGDSTEIIATTLWYTDREQYAMANVATGPKEIPPGESEKFHIIMDKPQHCIWCLLRFTPE